MAMTLTDDPTAALPATLRLGAVHLTVTDLDRSVAFYQDALGLRLHRREDPVAALGAGDEDLVVLHEDRAARPAGRHAGLYHYALLYPSREELARAALRLAATRTPIQGASDHGTHEAIYLPDPDGNGIELAADRGREHWQSFDVEFARGGPQPLDFPSLLAGVAGEEPGRHVAPGLVMGHVHLHVGDVDGALAFYIGTLGFALKGRMETAAFVAAGDYHHHLGLNTWRGAGVPGAPADAVGLRHWTIVVDDLAPPRARLPDAQPRDGGLLVRDPWGTAVLLTAPGS
jgi:catechol 2,3-dioxygenase